MEKCENVQANESKAYNTLVKIVQYSHAYRLVEATDKFFNV